MCSLTSRWCHIFPIQFSLRACFLAVAWQSWQTGHVNDGGEVERCGSLVVPALLFSVSSHSSVKRLRDLFVLAEPVVCLSSLSQSTTRGQSSCSDPWRTGSTMTSSPSSRTSLAPVSHVSSPSSSAVLKTEQHLKFLQKADDFYSFYAFCTVAFINDVF